MKKLVWFALLFVGFAGNAFADNRGEPAEECVSTAQGEADGNNKVTVTFTNSCDEQVFIIWCGDLAYSDKKCGDGPNGGFYTSSGNIAAGDSFDTKLESGGSYNYGACYGGVSFGSDEFDDKSNGSYSCVATGRYKDEDQSGEDH